MKTINFLTSHFLPENTACTNRVLAYIKVLEKNYKINIIALSEKGVKPKEKKVKYSRNVTIYYVHQEYFDGKNFVKRALKEVYYIKKLIDISNNTKSDIVIATSPYMFMIPLVGLLVNERKILDIRDLVWEYLDDKSLFNKSIKFFLRKIMMFGMIKFDKIIVTNTYENDLLISKYDILNNAIIPNGISLDRYESLISIKQNIDKFTITYVGNIGLAQNLKILVEAAEKMPNIQVVIIGDGIELQDLKHYKEEKNINNIDFLGKLEWDKLKEYYARTSVLYAQLDEKFVSAMPSKLYEYASLGFPIIYGGVGQATLFINELENAQCIKPNNLDELVNAINICITQKFLISIKNKKHIEENYIRELNSEKILKIIDSIKVK